MTNVADELEKVRRDLESLVVKYDNDRQVQVQKDEAQDKLLEMQFDGMKRELATYIRGKDLEDQKAFLLAKLSNIEIELRESIRSLGSSLREELGGDARRLHEQLDKIASSVTQQIKLVDDRLKANSESDNAFQEAMLRRLGLVETELGLDEAGGKKGGGLVGRLAALEEGEAKIWEVIQQIPGSPKAAKGKGGSVQAVQSAEVDPELVKMINDRLSALEETVSSLGRRDEKIEAEVKVVAEAVEEVKRSGKLDWLELRVKELADKKAGDRPDMAKMSSQINELSSRTMLLESAKEEQEVKIQEQLESMSKSLQALPPTSSKKAQAEEDDESEDGGLQAGGSTMFDPNNPELSAVNLFQNMERLQLIVECMEESMPLEVRRSIAFFKGPRKGKKKKRSSSPGPGPPLHLEAEVLGLKSESEEQALRVRRVEEMLQNQQENLHRALRGSQSEQEQMKAKVEDLWRQFPQITAILTPLQLQFSVTDAKQEGTSENTDDDPAALKVRATAAVEALKPLEGLIESSMQKSINQLRKDLLDGLIEVKGEVGLKASANDLSMLRDRMERWARSPSPGPGTPSLAGYKASPKGEGWLKESSREGGAARSKSGGRTDWGDCKRPTDPSVQSTGRLPALSSTR